MSFNVGDIITGIKNNGYGQTSNESLCIVREVCDDEIYVEILCHNDITDAIGNTFWVANDERHFELKSIEEFINEYPGCMMNKNRINKILEETRKEKEIVPYELSEEMRESLITEMKTLLEKFHYHPTDEALNKIIDEWRTNKADLIRMFEKHPNYNGKFQIAFDYDFDRELDNTGVFNFIKWLESDDVLNSFKKEVIIGEYTYTEIRKQYTFLDKIKDVFNYESRIETINGKRRCEYESEHEKWIELKREYENNEEVYISDGMAYEKRPYMTARDIDQFTSCLNRIGNNGNAFSQFVNEDTMYYFRNYMERKYSSTIRVGQRLSRAVNKVLGLIGVDKHTDYNREFAKFADSTNPLKIRRHTVLSIHPVDYYTMSFGNSWSSCHTIDKRNERGIDSENSYRGCNSSGTESYMLDRTSFLFYTVDASSDGTHLELDNKINRNMFHYYDNQLVQGRVYPQGHDHGSKDLYKDIREIVQKIIADILDVPNMWTNKSGIESCEDVIISTGTHYRDYENFSNCNVSTLKDDRDEHPYVKIGHYPICPCCGDEHKGKESIECCH